MAAKQPRPGLRPRYRRPAAASLANAAEHLEFIEQCAGAGALFDATGLTRALLGRGCSVADAMWVIHDQIAEGRYQYWPFDERPPIGNLPYWSDGFLPAGLTEVGGRLNVDTTDGCDWSWLGVTLPTDDSTPVVKSTVAKRGRKRGLTDRTQLIREDFAAGSLDEDIASDFKMKLSAVQKQRQRWVNSSPTNGKKRTEKRASN